MISKIIQKEKERQKEFLGGCGIAKLNPYRKEECVILCGRDEERCHECVQKQKTHKQSLINLKEYMEEELIFIEQLWKLLIDELPRKVELQVKILQKEEDITEITKMIERYDEKEN